MTDRVLEHLPRIDIAAPTFVQRAEMEAASAPGYTVPEWIPDDDVRLVDGDAEIAAGVRVLATPGHTPGHQSVVVEAEDRRAVIVGQVLAGGGAAASLGPAQSWR